MGNLATGRLGVVWGRLRAPRRVMSRPAVNLDNPEAELVFGLVGAVGTNLQTFQDGLIDLLNHFDYSATTIRLSDMIRLAWDEQEGPLPSEKPEVDRINTLMTYGTKLRERFGGDVLALHAVAELSLGRERIGERGVALGSHAAGGATASDVVDEAAGTFEGWPQPRRRHAYIFNSLKHPDEVSV